MTEREEANICLNCTKPRCNNCLGRKQVKNDVDWEEIGSLLSKGLSISEISKQTEIPHQTIRAFIKAHDMRPDAEKKLSEEELKELLTSGLSTREIAKIYGRSYSTVYWWVCKYGLNDLQRGKKNVLQEA